MVNIRAVVFDLDDTLFPENDFLLSGFLAVSKYLGKKYNLSPYKIFKLLKADFKKNPPGKHFDYILSRLQISKEKVSGLVNIYRYHKPKIKLYPDVTKLLDYLRGKKINLGIISDGPVKMQANKISALGIGKYFKKIILTDRWGIKYRKPNAKSFKFIIKKFHIKPGQVIYVADNSLKDFIGAKKCGFLTVKIIRKNGFYANIKETPQNRADFSISSLLMLKKYV